MAGGRACGRTRTGYAHPRDLAAGRGFDHTLPRCLFGYPQHGQRGSAVAVVAGAAGARGLAGPGREFGMSVHSEIDDTLRRLGSVEPPSGLERRINLRLQDSRRRFSVPVTRIIAPCALAASVALSAVV